MANLLEETAGLLEELIRIPSLNARLPGGPGEGEAARHLQAWLRARGVEAELQPVTEATVNLVAHVPGATPRGRLLLCSHLDTVGVDASMPDPFTPKRRDGAIYGRGACDAKASVAVMAVLLAEARRRPPAWDLTLAAVGDEEAGGSGVLHFLAQDHRFDASVVGEPTEERLVIAHRGAVRMIARLHGRSAHSSVPEEGANALVGAAALIQHLTGWAAEAPWPAHPLVGRPTLTPTQGHAGVGANVVPGEAVVTWDRRTVPPEDPREVAAAVQAEAARAPLPPGVRLTWEVPHVSDWLDTPADATIVKALNGALAAEGLPAEPVGATYGTDGCRIAAHGIPVAVFGPGSIRDAHGPGERVTLTALERAVAVLSRLLWP